jgi:hypothetical protein
MVTGTNGKMRTSHAVALAAAALIVGVCAARWYGVHSPRQQAGSGDNMMAKMLQDPQVTTAMQDMHAQYVKEQYAALVKQLNLTPEQSDAFYGLLINHEKNQDALGLQLLRGTNIPDATYAAGAAQKTLDDQLRSLLGESGYAQYKDYKAGMSDRNKLKRMQKDFADSPLSEVQQQRLLQLIKAKEQATPLPDSPDFNNKTPSGEDMAELMTLALKHQEEINRKVLQEAGDFLSPAQVQILGISQSNRLNFQKMTTSMTQKMFNASISNPAPATQ